MTLNQKLQLIANGGPGSGPRPGGSGGMLSREAGHSSAMKATRVAEQAHDKADTPAKMMKAAELHRQAGVLQKKYASDDQAVMHENAAASLEKRAKSFSADRKLERAIGP